MAYTNNVNYRRLTNAIRDAPAPAELTLQMVMPLMHDFVRAMHADLAAQMRVLAEAVSQQSNSTTQYLEDIVSGRVPFTVQVRAQPSSSGHASIIPSVIPTSAPDATSTPQQTSVDQANTNQPPCHRMSCGTKTIPDLWRE